MNPYFDLSFLEWFRVFFQRIGEIILCFCSGREVHLYSDEVQFLVLAIFGTTASFLGTLLSLKRMTMMVNALSHTMLFGIVISLLISPMLDESSLFIGALFSTLLTVLLVHFFSKVRHMTLDAANGMVFNFLFALAVTIISLLFRNSHVSVDMIIGNIDLITQRDLVPIFEISLVVLLVSLVCFRGFVVAIFDPIFAKTSALKPAFFDQLLFVLCGLSVISAFRAVGLVLVLEFFVVPAMIARKYTQTLRSLILTAVFITFGTSLLGIAMSRHFDSVYGLSLSTAALIAVLLSLEYAGTILFCWYGARKKSPSLGRM